MSKRRRGLSKRLRFEVLKRDGFTCRYCGVAAPFVALQVDHIRPVVDGGGDEVDNLITACQPCNNGKGAVPLGRPRGPTADEILARIDAEREVEEARELYSEWVREKKAAEAAQVSVLVDHWERTAWRARRTLNGQARQSIAYFLRCLSREGVIDAMDIARGRIRLPPLVSYRDATYAESRAAWGTEADRLFKYFCGICHRQIKDASPPRPSEAGTT